MKRIPQCVFTFFLVFYGYSQQYETRLDYFPSKKENVTEAEYHRGTFILERAYEAIKEDSLYMSYADHLNIGIAYKYLKEPKEVILNEIRLAEEENLYRTAAIFIKFYNTPEHFNLTQGEFDSLMLKFQMIYEAGQKVDEAIDIVEYASANNLDEDLLKLLDEIKRRDQKYRLVGIDNYLKNNKVQTEIDSQNMIKVDSLYAKYQTYLGKSLVGEEFNHVMWTVIQHSPLEKQEMYLPIVQRAAKEDELPENPFKMLVDRIYAQKYGYQIFGSQGGVDLASDSVMNDVKMKYGIE